MDGIEDFFSLMFQPLVFVLVIVIMTLLLATNPNVMQAIAEANITGYTC